MKPILLIKGDSSVCYGILEKFGQRLFEAFTLLGEEVIYADPSVEDIRGFAGREYKAVIAEEDLIYNNIDDSTGKPLFDSFIGPKFNIWLDNPLTFYGQLENIPGDYNVLTIDHQYVDLINRYYKGVKAFFMPPGGTLPKQRIPFEKREFTLSFVGTYSDWRSDLEAERSINDFTTQAALVFLERLLNDPNGSFEKTAIDTCRELSLDTSNEELFVQIMAAFRPMSLIAAAVYRERVIEKLLAGGITVDVFGDSWKVSPFADNRYLRIHPQVGSESVSDIYANSKISLNIMRWHKDSITERILDPMFAGSMVLSDTTPAINKAFIPGEEILLYSLDALDDLPFVIRNHENRTDIAENGMNKALSEHTWEKRAKYILELAERNMNDESDS